jgi:hypothetical protein
VRAAGQASGGGTGREVRWLWLLTHSRRLAARLAAGCYAHPPTHIPSLSLPMGPESEWGPHIM